MPINFGGGMIFPNSYNADQPDPPECPCEDGEPCEAHGTAAIPAGMAVSFETPAGTFDSPQACTDAGYPLACQAFALCDRAATVVLRHPALTAVLACDRCAERLS